jgi:hypothetical protein
MTQDMTLTEAAVAEGGAYDVIRKRLTDIGQTLKRQTDELNARRLEEFGSSAMALTSRVRLRTENNCLARDTVQVGALMVFGYNVFIGLKKDTKVEDVFALFRKETVLDEKNDGTHTLEPVPLEGTFLAEPKFQQDFAELYRYYKNARLLQLRNINGKLLAGFQIGDRLDDIRVFRWSVSADGKTVSYIDNRGERDIQLPKPHDFEWKQATREQTVMGRFPHVNILNRVFVETIDGDLTVKIENNTETGQGIYSEPVEDKTQSIDDGDIAYADLGVLILLKVRPYKESVTRYLVFNSQLKTVERIDVIGQSCVQLPEDHGIIFPGGYYLTTGVSRQFPSAIKGWRFKRQLRSPNGEDCLYVFYDPESGSISLLGYNLIAKTIQNPIEAQGYALASDGTLIISLPEPEPTRIHAMQIWKTPFYSEDHAAQRPATVTLLGRIGNAELVRGISELYSMLRLLEQPSVTSQLYESLSQLPRKFGDAYYWIQEMPELQQSLHAVADTAERVLDEFEKVESIRQKSVESLKAARIEQDKLLLAVRPEEWDTAESYAAMLDKLRRHRGHLKTLRELRYMDLPAIDRLDEKLYAVQLTLQQQTVVFLSGEQAFEASKQRLAELDAALEKADTLVALTQTIDAIQVMSAGLDLLSELASTLKVQDVTVQTRIVDAISEVYALLNQKRARAQNKAKSLGLEEATAQFGARFRLFSQSITNALAQSDSPEKCDEHLSRLLLQLEGLESEFSQYDPFIADIVNQREELYEVFETHKQQLLDARQQKGQILFDGGVRMLGSVERRVQRMASADDLNTFFSSDALVSRLQGIVEQLRQLEASVKADDLESRLKAIIEQARRSLRDRGDLYEGDGQVIKLGPRHRFSVNTQALDLTILPRDDSLVLHLTGTNYYAPVESEALAELRPYWSISLESETPHVYRAEYLAYQILRAAEQRQGLTPQQLAEARPDADRLLAVVRKFANERYREGYQKGVHDHDATALLGALLPIYDSAGLLRYSPRDRALAQTFWANTIKPLGPQWRPESQSETAELPPAQAGWFDRARAAYGLRDAFAATQAIDQLVAEVSQSMTEFFTLHGLSVDSGDMAEAAAYLVAELAEPALAFVVSQYAQQLVDEFRRNLTEEQWRLYQNARERLKGQIAARWQLGQAWLEAMLSQRASASHLSRYVPEAIALLNTENRLSRRPSQATVEFTISGLLGDHPTIQNQSLRLSLDEYLSRLRHHADTVVPGYRRYLQVRQQVIDKERNALRLDEFKPKPLTSFVRNRLINDCYLPIIGDNFAKQMGTVGEGKRTDSQGLLMMISPPGYGKTTLMEYVADRLGLIFMKINCPSLGHDVVSLDPDKAPHATARQELEKLNLALEMGNNVMLYLDDIQHTHPEFLQKFISLCDGTRRIEGIWRGQPQTYDLRGRKFAVVMAGNPYTESGEMFKIPDMLANRADIYNLGEILGGMEEAFELSYIENSLTSNPVLAPLATRDLADFYAIVKMALGEAIPTTSLRHAYSGAELNEIKAVLQKQMLVQAIVLKVNQQYIASAAQDDRYRKEPPFKLQGSYRNMTKMASKVSAVMNEAELQQLIEDHYQGESQLLTTGAEENLLKLAEIRGTLSTDQQKRWEEIKQAFRRNQSMGGSDQDAGGRIVAQLVDLVEGVRNLRGMSEPKQPEHEQNQHLLADSLQMFSAQLQAVLDKPDVNRIEIINHPLPQMGAVLESIARTLELSLAPLVHNMEKKLDIDLGTHRRLLELGQQLRDLKDAGSGASDQ